MAAVLLMVGQGLEDPEIVARLLDLEVWPQKPQYAMAAEVIMPSHPQFINPSVAMFILVTHTSSHFLMRAGAASAVRLRVPRS